MNRKLSDLKVNPLNPRGDVVVDDSLRELAESIRSHGLLQPILVTPDGTVIAGHRRLKASQLIGMESVPVVVRDFSETQQLQAMLIENLQREGLSTIQTAKAYALLIRHGLFITDIAKATGFKSASISAHLEILKLPPQLHEYFNDCRLPMGSRGRCGGS